MYVCMYVCIEARGEREDAAMFKADRIKLRHIVTTSHTKNVPDVGSCNDDFLR